LTEQALRFLEYAFLALLYLFFLRVVRAVWAEVHDPKVVPAQSPAGHPSKPADRPPRDRGRLGRERVLPQQLVVLGRDGAAGPAFGLSQEVTIGRAPGCAIALPTDNFVSHLHARLFLQDHEYWVEDLGSTNGTLVNGRKVTSAVPLRRGDRLQVGRTLLELQK
jgi:hypothetical protein